MLKKNYFAREKEELCSKMSTLLPRLRNALSLSQTELGEYVSVSRQTISEIERGEYQMSWNQFASFYLIFGANKESHDIMAENQLDVQNIAPVIAVPKNKQNCRKDQSPEDFSPDLQK